MGIYNKFLDFIGIEEEDDDKREEDLLEEEEEALVRSRQQSRQQTRPQPEPEQKKSTREQRLQGGGEAVNMAATSAMKMIVYHPVTYEDAQNIIDNLKARKPVIVNMEELEVSVAQRILDFLSGAIYALSGTIMKISKGIFVVAPNNYDVVGNEEDSYSDM